jgi:NAD(P)-dependent dehydrogenase (short-subunit alcohol dehydrogenase family)
VNLTRHIALYHGPQGIRANCVCPGHIATPRLRELYEREPGLVQLYPVGRLGRVEDLVAAYLYLASPDAGFVNGAVLMLDGGYSAT